MKQTSHNKDLPNTPANNTPTPPAPQKNLHREESTLLNSFRELWTGPPQAKRSLFFDDEDESHHDLSKK